jgi:uracil-DNA glycosylase
VCDPAPPYAHLNRVAKRATSASAPQLFPQAESLDELRNRTKHCKACDLRRNATQTVFGEGAEHPKIMLVGEQPGDQEDLQGRPFVGPAGKLLDSALRESGVDREKTYITNAVKHFKWEPRGKRRIHKKPSGSEIAACRPWLDAKIAALQPEVIVCLGATAAQALLGRDFRVTQHDGELMKSSPAHHHGHGPSIFLRAPNEESRHAEMERFIGDLKKLSRFTR